MIGEAIFFALLQGIGFVVARITAGRDLSLTAAATLALPTGAAAFVLLSWLRLVVGLGWSLWTTLAVLAVAAMATALAGKHRPQSSPVVLAVGAASILAVGGLSAAFSALPLTQVTPDSFRYIQIGSIVAETGSLDEVRDFLLIQRPLFLPLLYAPAVTLHDGVFMASAIPLLTVTGVAATASLAHAALRKMGTPTPWRMTLLGSALVVLVTTNRAVYNVFYVNTHMMFALYLGLVVLALWSARAHLGRPPVILLATWLAALLLLRPEAMAVISLVLVVMVVDDRFAISTRMATVLPPSFMAIAWYGIAVRARVATGTGTGDTLVNGSLVIGVGMVALVALAAKAPHRLRSLVRRAPMVALAALALLVVSVAVTTPSVISGTAASTWDNVAGKGFWGVTWIGLPVLVLVAATARLPASAYWLVPLGGFPLLLLALNDTRGAAVTGPLDSTNRMLMHIVFVALLFVVLTTGRAIASGVSAQSTATSLRAKRHQRPDDGTRAVVRRGERPRPKSS